MNPLVLRQMQDMARDLVHEHRIVVSKAFVQVMRDMDMAKRKGQKGLPLQLTYTFGTDYVATDVGVVLEKMRYRLTWKSDRSFTIEF